MNWFANEALHVVTARTMWYSSSRVMFSPFHSSDHSPYSHCALKTAPYPRDPEASVNRLSVSELDQTSGRKRDLSLNSDRNEPHSWRSSRTCFMMHMKWNGFETPIVRSISLLRNARPGIMTAQEKFSVQVLIVGFSKWALVIDNMFVSGLSTFVVCPEVVWPPWLCCQFCTQERSWWCLVQKFSLVTVERHFHGRGGKNG